MTHQMVISDDHGGHSSKIKAEMGPWLLTCLMIPCRKLGLGPEPAMKGKEPIIGSLGGPGGKFFGFLVFK